MNLGIRQMLRTIVGVALVAAVCATAYTWSRMVSGPCRTYAVQRPVADTHLLAIANAVEEFGVRSGSLPADLSTLFERAPVDPWGFDYDYATDGRSFRVTSFGTDGLPGGEGEKADFSIDSGKPQ